MFDDPVMWGQPDILPTNDAVTDVMKKQKIIELNSNTCPRPLATRLPSPSSC